MMFQLQICKKQDGNNDCPHCAKLTANDHRICGVYYFCMKRRHDPNGNLGCGSTVYACEEKNPEIPMNLRLYVRNLQIRYQDIEIARLEKENRQLKENIHSIQTTGSYASYALIKAKLDAAEKEITDLKEKNRGWVVITDMLRRSNLDLSKSRCRCHWESVKTCETCCHIPSPEGSPVCAACECYNKWEPKKQKSLDQMTKEAEEFAERQIERIRKDSF